ncbi:MAG: SBBP repeat-containing protein [Ignavibacteria bacterium]|nr:SBBP repeat-containing protein [Ignavibacteria bacterium]
MKKIIFILFIAHCTLQIADAQNPTQEWVRRYGGIDGQNDGAMKVVLDGLGNVFVGGLIVSNIEKSNITVIKYNVSGAQQWVATWNSPENYYDHFGDMVVDSIGNVYITGYTGPDFGPADCITIKFNSSGAFQWVKYYNFNGGSDAGDALILDRNGNLILTGNSSQATFTIKYDTNGDSIWVKRYFLANNNCATFSIGIDDSNNVYTSGIKRQISPFNEDYLLIKYNSSGAEQWVRNYGESIEDVFRKHAVDNAGNSYLTGYSFNGSNSDYLTVRYSSSGVFQWSRRYNGTSSDEPQDIVTDNLGNSYVTGSSSGAGQVLDYLTIKYNGLGDSLWVRRYSNTGVYNDEAYSITLDSLNNVYITGRSEISNGFDFATLKYSNLGVQMWVARYPGAASSLEVRGNMVYVTGSNSDSGSSDFLTIKYSQAVGVYSNSDILPRGYSLYQNYPNPYNPYTKIEFAIPLRSHVKITVYGITGKEIIELFDKDLEVGHYGIDFDGTALSSGIYFYSLVTEDFKETKKMLLIK